MYNRNWSVISEEGMYLVIKVWQNFVDDKNCNKI